VSTHSAPLRPLPGKRRRGQWERDVVIGAVLRIGPLLRIAQLVWRVMRATMPKRLSASMFEDKSDVNAARACGGRLAKADGFPFHHSK